VRNVPENERAPSCEAIVDKVIVIFRNVIKVAERTEAAGRGEVQRARRAKAIAGAGKAVYAA
jgi:hypothetical protein